MKTLVLLRGLPGSGKTTFANSILAISDKAVVNSADDYFYNDDGQYVFDPKKLKDAHQNCIERTYRDMSEGVPMVIVANTFTQEWEMEKYILAAREHGYQVHTLICENRHGSDSVHNVPEESINRMRNRFEVVL